MRISDWSSDGCSADLTLITGYVDELVVDTAIRLFVVADIPAGLANNAVAGVTLRATAREGGGIGVQGTAITETTRAHTDRKSVVQGKSVSVRVDLGGRRNITKTQNHATYTPHT